MKSKQSWAVSLCKRDFKGLWRNQAMSLGQGGNEFKLPLVFCVIQKVITGLSLRWFGARMLLSGSQTVWEILQLTCTNKEVWVPGLWSFQCWTLKTPGSSSPGLKLGVIVDRISETITWTACLHFAMWAPESQRQICTYQLSYLSLCSTWTLLKITL